MTKKIFEECFFESMHIDQFKGLDGFELSKKQEKVFTAFLTDDTVDEGLGTLRATFT